MFKNKRNNNAGKINNTTFKLALNYITIHVHSYMSPCGDIRSLRWVSASFIKRTKVIVK
jgi:hypothetical protein